MRRWLALGVAALWVAWPRFTQDSVLQLPEWVPVKRTLVEAGDSFEGVLMRLGLPQALRGQVVLAAAGVMDPRTLKPGEPLLLVMGAQGDSLRLVHLEGDVRCVEVDLPATLHGGALQITSGKVSARVQVLGAKAQLVEREGQVGSTLYEAMVDAGGSPQQVLAFADIFQWDVDFLTDIRQEDRFWLVVEESRVPRPYLGDTVTVEGRILAASFQNGGDLLRACRHEGCGENGFYDAKGQSFQKQFLKSPLSFRRVSSQFGMRNHPVLRRVRMHHGIDYSAPSGTPVVSAANGVVVKAGWENGYGKVVRIRHDRGRTTVYGHLSAIEGDVRAGRRVQQNQLIGRVGSTGLSTGPHLHYEVQENGRPVDPVRAQGAPGKPVPASCLQDYLAQFRRWFP